MVAIIAVLISILMPALGQARQCAQQARSLSNVRQMMMGYKAYSEESRGSVLYGYLPDSGMVDGQPFPVRDPDSGHTFGSPVNQRYPWRLSPYVRNVWGVIHNYKTPPLPLSTDSHFDALMKAYQLSVYPTFGLNTAYVGGHAGMYQGFIKLGKVNGVDNYVPNRDAHVVFRESEVRRPAALITFIECKQRGGGFTESDAGLNYATAPFCKGPKWRVGGNGRIEIIDQTGSLIGIPEGRYKNRAVTSFFDGHAETRSPAQLFDMRAWANRATELDYDFVNNR